MSEAEIALVHLSRFQVEIPTLGQNGGRLGKEQKELEASSSRETNIPAARPQRTSTHLFPVSGIQTALALEVRIIFVSEELTDLSEVADALNRLDENVDKIQAALTKCKLEAHLLYIHLVSEMGKPRQMEELKHLELECSFCSAGNSQQTSE
eukprot:m.107029 g.107029  ORF g.107029 m.107029 type:complete len:152 (+) comp37278_c0_seq13:747-1202(+)